MARLNADFEVHHVSIPIRERDQVLGVINLVVQNGAYLEEMVLKTIEIIESQVSEFVSKAWLEMKLSNEEKARKRLMKALIKAHEEERSRLAKDLHDGAGQMLTSVLLQLKAIERDVEIPELSSRVSRTCQNVSDVIEYVRHISYQNRPIVIDELGLDVAIENLIEDTVLAAGVQTKVNIEINKASLLKEVESTIYRITQECLTNTIRHANAQNLSLRLWNDPTSLNLEIIDDGIGFDVEKVTNNRQNRRLGLAAIKERVEILGGELSISSNIEEGTSLFIRLPMLEGAYDE